MTHRTEHEREKGPLQEEMTQEGEEMMGEVEPTEEEEWGRYPRRVSTSNYWAQESLEEEVQGSGTYIYCTKRTHGEAAMFEYKPALFPSYWGERKGKGKRGQRKRDVLPHLDKEKRLVQPVVEKEVLLFIRPRLKWSPYVISKQRFKLFSFKNKTKLRVMVNIYHYLSRA